MKRLIVQKKNVRLGTKHIGRVEGSTLFMRRNTGRHLYRVLNAWCLNVDVVNGGFEQFVIDTEQCERFVIRYDTIQRLRTKLNLFITFQDERQLAIPVRCWDKYDYSNLSFPVLIGLLPEEFVESCRGRWRSRLIAYKQLDIFE